MGMKIGKGMCKACLAKVGPRQKWCDRHRPMKYKNRPTAGRQSKREANREAQLTLMLREGLISDLRMQVPYPLVVEGVKIGVFIADFVYEENGIIVVEDAKGRRTKVYNIKKKLMLALYKITIREV